MELHINKKKWVILCIILLPISLFAQTSNEQICLWNGIKNQNCKIQLKVNSFEDTEVLKSYYIISINNSFLIKIHIDKKYAGWILFQNDTLFIKNNNEDNYLYFDTSKFYIFYDYLYFPSINFDNKISNKFKFIKSFCTIDSLIYNKYDYIDKDTLKINVDTKNKYKNISNLNLVWSIKNHIPLFFSYELKTESGIKNYREWKLSSLKYNKKKQIKEHKKYVDLIMEAKKNKKLNKISENAPF